VRWYARIAMIRAATAMRSVIPSMVMNLLLLLS
jgi:hypothetical protein